jgi:hypothetical protein
VSYVISAESKPGTASSIVPKLRKEREERGPRRQLILVGVEVINGSLECPPSETLRKTGKTALEFSYIHLSDLHLKDGGEI